MKDGPQEQWNMNVQKFESLNAIVALQRQSDTSPSSVDGGVSSKKEINPSALLLLFLEKWISESTSVSRLAFCCSA